MERNLTEGSIFKNIIYFSIPYLLAYFLQTLYGMADLFIIGQFEGVASTTAVSVGSQVMHMLTVMIVGLAMGATVNIGQAIGARDKQAGGGGYGKYSYFIYDAFCYFDGCSIFLRKWHCRDHVCTGRGSSRNSNVFKNLFYGNPFYYSL